MKQLLVIMLSIAAFSCTSTKNKPVCEHHTPGAVVIIPADTVGGRVTYTVIFDDDKALDHMYGEEIGQSLVTGTWGYDEDLVITTEK